MDLVFYYTEVSVGCGKKLTGAVGEIDDLGVAERQLDSLAHVRLVLVVKCLHRVAAVLGARLEPTIPHILSFIFTKHVFDTTAVRLDNWK